MANKTINELNSVTPSSTSKIPIYEGGGTGKATAAEILRTQDILFADDEEEPTSAVSFESVDTELTPASSESVQLLNGSDTWGSRFYKISQMFKNIRYLFSKTNNLETELNKKLPLWQYVQTVTSTNPVSVANSTNTDITTLTIPETGTYYVSYNVNFATSSTVGYVQGGWHENGVSQTFARCSRSSSVENSGTAITTRGVNLASFSVGTVICLHARQTTGSAVDTYGNLSIVKLSDGSITSR